MSEQNFPFDIKDIYQKSFDQLNPYIEKSIKSGNFDMDEKSFSVYIITGIYSGIYNLHHFMSQKFNVPDYLSNLKCYLLDQCESFITEKTETYINDSLNMAYQTYSMYSNQMYNALYVIDFNNYLKMCPVVKSVDGKSYIIGVIFYNRDINKYTVMPALEEIPYVNIFSPKAANCYESLNYNEEIDNHNDTTIYDRSNSSIMGEEITYEIFDKTNQLNNFVFNAYKYSMFPKIFSSIIDKVAFENAIVSTQFDDPSMASKIIRDNYYYCDHQIMMNIDDFSLDTKVIEKEIEKYKQQVKYTTYSSFKKVENGFNSQNDAMVYLFNLNTKVVASKYKNQASEFINDILNF